MDDMNSNMNTNKNASTSANTNNVIHHDNTPSVGDEVGEAAGGISGVVTGAAIGSLGGPIGTVIGGIAGAIGGWWAGRAVSEAAKNFTNDDDTFYRSHYASSDSKLADRSYEDVSPAYQLGHLAGHNPEYSGRSFDTVESDLRRGWDSTATKAHGEWDHVKGYARDAYNRSAASSNRPMGAVTTNANDSVRDDANNAANLDSKRIDDAAGYKAF
ncbi:MAG: hypothetical protein ACR2GG_06350 [Gemmatimonadaceae bacterium]